MNTLDTLIKAREVISAPENWCKYLLVDRYRQDGGIAHCAVGAVGVALGARNDDGGDVIRLMIGSENNPVLSALADAAAQLGTYRSRRSTDWHVVTLFNNTYDHADVMKMFDLAIEAERAKLAPKLAHKWLKQYYIDHPEWPIVEDFYREKKKHDA